MTARAMTWLGDDLLDPGAKRERDLVCPGTGLLREALANRPFGGGEGGLEKGDEALFLAGEVLVESLERATGALDDQLDGDV